MSEPTADPPGWVPELNVRARGSDWTLRGGSGYYIGRDPRAAIVLDDPRVSWRHALLRPVGGTWVLEDSGSTNGTWVGTERVSRIEIRGILVACFSDPDDGAVVRFQPEPRPRDRATPRRKGPITCGGGEALITTANLVARQQAKRGYFPRGSADCPL